MKQALLTAALLTACGLALAKLPPPDDAAKAKAAETAAKAAWQGKIDAFLLCKAQDRVAARYAKGAGKAMPASAKDPKAVPVKAAAQPAGSAASAAAAATAAPAAPAAAMAAAPATAASGTPVPTVAAVPPLPPCIDPGPFAYNPPEQKPLETSGAHSPSGTAASPPSVKQPAAEMAPAKKKS
jgi:hypothetical protein